MPPMAMSPMAMTPGAMTPGAMTPVAMSPMPIPGPIVSEKKKVFELLSDCRKCYAEDSDEYTSKIIYSGAVLEVCIRKLVFYPEVVNFIEDEKDKYVPPKLIMLDDAGQDKEHTRIDNWKREHILQFLKEKLKPTSAV
ncbi:selenoprotein F [Tanacetum coccineum]|uniref:Selenoprotein F n=1 Tax=Tanacetum coccineum TaxID=301880 RepID=A0ABQ5BI54_9ASTR